MTEPLGWTPAAIAGAGLRAAERAWRATGWTGQHLRHVAAMIRQGRNPAARVYESLGSECFLALAPGWLNLGLWEGPGTEAEAEAACRRLVQTVASALPAGGVIVDVGNGLGTQDPLIAESIAPRRLVAVNIAEWQLAAGRDRLREAAAAPVAGDAARLPLADRAADGLISVEAAFHFRSRRAFFAECRPGAAMAAGQIAAATRAAGLVDVEVTRCGDRVIPPALRVIAARLSGSPSAPLGQHAATRVMLWQVELLWRHRIIDYLLLRATRPG